jgi:Ca-activated chloride channel family protein
MLLAFVLAVNLLAQAQSPQNASPQSQRDRTLRVDVDLVLVPTTVMDPYGRLVTGLEKRQFRVLEDSVEQEVLNFSQEEAPISVGLIFDRSGSMSGAIAAARHTAMKFFRTANPGDEFFLLLFAGKVQEVTDFTSNAEELQFQVMEATPKGLTALHDAIYAGLHKMRDARNPRRALIVISDGEENHSRFNEKEIERFAREADVQVYSIGAFDPNGWTLLAKLANYTGGRMFGSYSWDNTVERIWLEMRNQYVIAYRSSNAGRDGRWRKIKVEVKPERGMPPLRIFSKTGYYAPLP